MAALVPRGCALDCSGVTLLSALWREVRAAKVMHTDPWNALL
jgi:hypothetical protein